MAFSGSLLELREKYNYSTDEIILTPDKVRHAPYNTGFVLGYGFKSNFAYVKDGVVLRVDFTESIVVPNVPMVRLSLTQPLKVVWLDGSLNRVPPAKSITATVDLIRKETPDPREDGKIYCYAFFPGTRE
ncbi:hypothetical protein KBC75_05460 [Candidatus Shapirobacteria bacterium]|nr:hypothetical protein [Candidatus Shapirobacteria bacterium]